MIKGLCIFCISLFLLFPFGLVLASNEKPSKMYVGGSIEEALSTINEIIESSIRLAEAELERLQKVLKEEGESIQKRAGKSIVQGLEKIVAELRKLDQALKKNMAEREGLSTEKLNQYSKNLDRLEERLGQFRKRIEKFARDIEKEWRLMEEPVRQKVQDVLKEIERAINRLRERLKRQRQIDNKTIYT